MYAIVIGSDPKTERLLCYGLGSISHGRKGREGVAYLEGARRQRRARRRPGEGPDKDQGTWRRAAALAPVVAARKKATRYRGGIPIEGEREKQKAARKGNVGTKRWFFLIVLLDFVKLFY